MTQSEVVKAKRRRSVRLKKHKDKEVAESCAELKTFFSKTFSLRTFFHN